MPTPTIPPVSYTTPGGNITFKTYRFGKEVRALSNGETVGMYNKDTGACGVFRRNGEMITHLTYSREMWEREVVTVWGRVV